MEEAVSLLIVSEVRLYREGLAMMLRRDPRVHRVAACGISDSQLSAALQHSPNVALLDAASPGAAALIPQLRSATTVVILGLPDIDSRIVDFIEAGAHGYVCRNAALEDVIDIALSALHGELQCSASVAGELQRRLLAICPTKQLQPGNPFSLTDRETEILKLIADGESNKKIASELHISPSTVKNHVHNILTKLGIETRSKAAARWHDYLVGSTNKQVEPS